MLICDTIIIEEVIFMKKQHSLFNIITKENSIPKHENMKTEKIKNNPINKINSNSKQYC